MADRPLFTLTPIFIALGSMLGAGGVFGFLIGYYTAAPTLSTMEAVIDRAGMRWSVEDTKRYCSESGYMHPAWDSTLVAAEVLPARDNADVGTLVCYWRLKR